MNSRIPSDSDVIEPFVSADCVIKVACSGNAKINDFSDVSRVKKFELTDEEYEKRSGSFEALISRDCEKVETD